MGRALSVSSAARLLFLLAVEVFLLLGASNNTPSSSSSSSSFSSSLASLLPRQGSSNLFLGIAPQDEEYYSGDVIFCRDGSKFFTKDRLNDGFCDCPDGTDEPGTSACPESRFYCRNIGDIPRILYSSRVNDHICDCCDGSDESAGHTTCPNTCLKGQVASNNSKIDFAERRSSDKFHEQPKRIVDVERLVDNLTDLRVAIITELLIFCIVSSCFCHWNSRPRRRRYLLKS